MRSEEKFDKIISFIHMPTICFNNQNTVFLVYFTYVLISVSESKKMFCVVNTDNLINNSNTIEKSNFILHIHFIQYYRQQNLLFYVSHKLTHFIFGTQIYKSINPSLFKLSGNFNVIYNKIE